MRAKSLAGLVTLAQIAAPPAGAIENWLMSAAAVASIVLMGKKLFSHTPTDGEFVSKTQFQQEVGAVRDKIDNRFVALLEKLNEAKGELLTRLNQVDASVARLDERTKRLDKA